MNIDITKKDVSWGYLGLIASNGINLLLLPFVLSYLSSNELGLWYTFTSIGALASLLDFGMMTTITRNVALVWSGVDRLSSEGFSIETKKKGGPNYLLFRELHSGIRVIYLVIAALAFALLISIGSMFIHNVSSSTIKFTHYMPAWIIYSVAIFLNIYYSYWNSLLKGIGAIAQSNQAMVISKIVQFLFTLILLLNGYGLLGVAIGYCLSTLTLRMISILFFKKKVLTDPEASDCIKPIKDKSVAKSIIKVIWPNAYKQGIITISNYLSSKASVLLCSAFLGLEVTATVGLTQQLFEFILPVGNALINTYIPLFSLYRVQNNIEALKKLFYLTSGVALYISILGGILGVFFAPMLLTIIGSNSQIIATFPALIMLFNYVLNNYHMICSGYIATGNRIPMYKAFAISSAGIIVLQYIMLNTTNIGIWAVILPSLFCQLVYNNWKWPLEVSKEFNITIGHLIISEILAPYNRFKNFMVDYLKINTKSI